MTKGFIRIWTEVEMGKVSKHLIIVGDVLGGCENCGQWGLDYVNSKACPKCKTEFRYVTLRDTNQRDSRGYLDIKRVKDKRPDLIFIDYNDFKRLKVKIEAKRFFQEGK